MYSHAQQTDLALSEMQSRFSKLISLGTIKEIDHKVARVRVEMGDWVTGWLPWLTAQASHDITWQAPEIGEQVIVLAPCGDTSQGVVLGSVYSQAHPPAQAEVPEESLPDVKKVRFQDGGFFSYDRVKHQYDVYVPDTEGEEKAKIVIHSGHNIAIDCVNLASVKAKNITLEAVEKIELKGKNITSVAAEKNELKGDTALLESSGNMQITSTNENIAIKATKDLMLNGDSSIKAQE